jgi:hypothetical protein
MQQKSLIKQKILQYLDILGVSKYLFYQETGITRGVLNKEGGISEDNLTKFIAHYPEVSLLWLLTGEEPIVASNKTTVLISKDKSDYKDLAEARLIAIDGLQFKVDFLELKIKESASRTNEPTLYDVAAEPTTKLTRESN